MENIQTELDRLVYRWKYHGEAPTLETLTELAIDLDSARDTAHDECYSSDYIEESVVAATSELRDEIEELKTQLSAKPKRARKKKTSVDVDSIRETYARAKDEYFRCDCHIDDECAHARRKMTAERWLRRAKELAS